MHRHARMRGYSCLHACFYDEMNCTRMIVAGAVSLPWTSPRCRGPSRPSVLSTVLS